VSIAEQLQSIRGVVLDADGVFFDGRETRSETGHVTKTRDYRDGQGLSFLRGMGIRIMFATGEGEPLESIVRKLNTLPSARKEPNEAGYWPPVSVRANLKQGKGEAIATWMESYGLRWPNVAYIGDDRTDCEAMAIARMHGGLVVVPADAQRVVRKYAHVTLTKNGGAGAIREFAEMVCDARGIDEEGLATA
jgi:3-deoxy-D-manno-octulosonate 8-phosphate phosphatase (KDO 8-P phosphatase)